MSNINFHITLSKCDTVFPFLTGSLEKEMNVQICYLTRSSAKVKKKINATPLFVRFYGQNCVL